ncbi:hypothetical protein [Amycolatopsis sp. cmx-11-51]|uniref:hypothetical protein n=1 Tax=unclassified Amycolatopsis TaxID=2618356 RepID=UPI0039E3D9F6
MSAAPSRWRAAYFPAGTGIVAPTTLSGVPSLPLANRNSGTVVGDPPGPAHPVRRRVLPAGDERLDDHGGVAPGCSRTMRGSPRK